MPHILRRVPLCGLATLIVLLALTASAHAQATRTWISGVGDDVNPCSRTAPCKTIAGAISKTASGGEINAVDSGGFGAVTITKPITIDFQGVHGSILNSSVNGVIVNAGANDQVILRNLSINGAGTGGSGLCDRSSGLNGVRILQAGAVSIEHVTISQDTQAGVLVAPNATGDIDVAIRDTEIAQACQHGVRAAATAAGGKANVVLDGVTVRRTGTALSAGAGATITAMRSALLFNPLGVFTEADGAVHVFDDVVFSGNDANGTPTSTIFPPQPPETPQPPTVVTQTVTQTVTAPTPPPAVAATCTVPKVEGTTRATATSRLKKAGCALGRVTTRRTKNAKLVGRVLTQKVEAGTKVLDGTKVSVVLGRR